MRPGTRFVLGTAAAIGVAALVRPVLAQDQPSSRIEIERPVRRQVPPPEGWQTLIPPPAPKAQPDPRLLLAPRDQGIPMVGDRMDRQQTEEELVRTTLLNRFGGLGFSQLGSFSREGEFYAAEVQRIDGRWVWILIDPRTGEITPRP
ncbi:hypothetical protein [Arenibaculum pallidiluteum]|uniref:hypothetical protein n=1 Tax=Arenibaculum pallidiluteum TaxID=2812559 RepID=UPI001A97B117|nr:hypothetical protein [Arenibaculum pallidiluteum]